MSPGRVLAEHDAAELTEWMAYFGLLQAEREGAALDKDLTQRALGNRKEATIRAKGRR